MRDASGRSADAEPSRVRERRGPEAAGPAPGALGGRSAGREPLRRGRLPHRPPGAMSQVSGPARFLARHRVCGRGDAGRPPAGSRGPRLTDDQGGRGALVEDGARWACPAAPVVFPASACGASVVASGATRDQRPRRRLRTCRQGAPGPRCPPAALWVARAHTGRRPRRGGSGSAQSWARRRREAGRPPVPAVRSASRSRACPAGLEAPRLSGSCWGVCSTCAADPTVYETASFISQ